MLCASLFVSWSYILSQLCCFSYHLYLKNILDIEAIYSAAVSFAFHITCEFKGDVFLIGSFSFCICKCIYFLKTMANVNGVLIPRVTYLRMRLIVLRK